MELQGRRYSEARTGIRRELPINREALTSSEYHTTIQRLERDEERLWESYKDALREEAESGASRKREKRTYRNSPKREETKQSTKILNTHRRHVEYILKVHDKWMRQQVEKT